MNAPRLQVKLTETALPSRLPRLLDAVREVCEAAGADVAASQDLRLAVEEACVNVMHHAYPHGAPGDVTLDVAREPWQGAPAIRVIVQDRGMPFDPLLLPRPPPMSADTEQLAIGGLGVHLMRQVTDVQSYHHDAATGNNLTLVKFLNPRQGENKLNITISRQDSVTILAISGSVDSLNADQLAESFARGLTEGRARLVADFSAVSYTSSAGLRSLLAAVKDSRRLGGDLRIAAVQPGVQRVLSLSGFTSIIKIFDDVEAAVSSYGPAA